MQKMANFSEAAPTKSPSREKKLFVAKEIDFVFDEDIKP